MYDSIKKETVGDYTAYVYYDEYGDDPRSWDNLGTMIYFHNRYSLPHEADINSDDYSSWDEMEEAITRKFGSCVILPVYMYDHSGLAFSTGSFHGRLPQGHAYFDSGRVGFIFVTKKKIRKEYGKAGKKEIEKAIDIMKGEVDVYGKYANGECYRFVVEDPEGEQVDSCGGYYDSEDAMNEALGIAKTFSRV